MVLVIPFVVCDVAVSSAAVLISFFVAGDVTIVSLFVTFVTAFADGELVVGTADITKDRVVTLFVDVVSLGRIDKIS